MKEKVFKTRSYILIFAAVLALLLVLPLFFGAGPESSLALEQSVRCGMQEHSHGQDCYIGDVLVCREKNHSHGENCYLVRLEDNDINRLLSLVDAHEQRSLEAVIGDTLAQAADMDAAAALLGGTAWTAGDDGDLLTNDDIVMLNHAITDGAISSGVVMNESLSTSWSSSQGLSESQVISMLGGVSSGNVSAYAVGGTPNTGNNTINFYILLDGKITFVNSRSFDNTSGNRQISYSNIVNSYTSGTSLVTGLSTDTLSRYFSTYYIRYNRDGDVSSSTSFDNYSTHRESSIRFSNNSSPHYGILSYEQFSTDPVPFYTVKLDYSAVGGTNQVRYVEEGLNSGLNPDTTSYLWYSSAESTTPLTESEISAALDSITETTTLYARPKNFTATFVKQDGTTAAGSISGKPTDGKLTVTMPELPGENLIWAIKDDPSGISYTAGDEVTIKSDTTFVAVPDTCTLTLTDENGSNSTVTVKYGGTYALPSLPDGWSWVGSDGSVYSGGDTTAPITENISFTAMEKIVVNYVYIDTSKNSTSTVSPGTITLPSLSGGNYWMDEDGNTYDGGSQVAVTKNTTFTERFSITLNYDRNFPSTNSFTVNSTFYDNYGNSGVPVPTILANSGSTYETELRYTEQVTVESLTHRNLYYSAGTSQQDHFSIYFKGWQVTVDGETLLIEPGTKLDWNTLVSLADDNNEVNFEGLWEYGAPNSVSFYIELNAKAHDSTTGTGTWGGGSYTKEVFSTHLFISNQKSDFSDYSDNVKYWAIADDTSENSVDADKTIRQLYGTGVYMPITDADAEQSLFYTLSFPDDDILLAELKALAESGTTLMYDDGTGTAYAITDTSTIDSDHYAVRWYVFKPEPGSDWHVDGRLIKKVGTVKVNKNFGGNATLTALAIEQAEKDYANGKSFITASCTGYYLDPNDESSFVTYTSPRQVELWFTPQTDAQPYGYIYDAATDTYAWVIEGVEAHEKWVVTEHPPDLPEDALDMSEWVWVDSFNGTTDSGVSATTTVTGVTYAADSYSEDWLTVDFSNLYHRSNTILIRKVDGNTMAGLSGAVFNIYDHKGQLMHFTYNADTGIYEYNPDGTGIFDLATGANGFLEYTLGNFSYDNGNITIHEKTPPSGYGIVGDVVMGFTDSNQTIGIVSSESTQAASYANGVLTVKNYSDGKADVTASKVWDCDEAYYDGLAVRFELFANGKLASAAIPGFSSYGSYYIYLDEHGAYFETNSDGTPRYVSTTPWSYTWEDLPTVLSGQGISYTIVETQVGDEAADSSGNFPNWICDTLYNDVTTDQLGNQTVEIALRNTPNRAMIRLTKYDMSGSSTLPGAQFTLIELNSSGNETGTSYTYTTDQHGVITFDNLKYETWYKLSENKAPEGYIGMSSAVYVRLAQNGVVTVTTDMNDTGKTSSYAFYPNQANNVTVLNMYAGPLPETGGGGIYGYILGGALLMAAAAVLMIYRTRRRKGETPYV